MNWGKGLTIFIIIFIISMLGIVYISFQQTNEMIEDNYYARELKYQEVIDAKTNLSQYKNHTYLYDSANFILVKLPADISTNIKNGKLKFLKLDNEKYDLNVPINTSHFIVSKEKLQSGFYHVKLQWENNNSTYFYEKEVKISS